MSLLINSSRYKLGTLGHVGTPNINLDRNMRSGKNGVTAFAITNNFVLS